MSPTAPQIGFDRFIQLDWVAAALKVRAGLANLDELNHLLDAAGLGLAARKKTRTVLNRLWLEPRVDLVDFANRGAEIFKANPGVSVAALAWGMAIATYPFFGRVAELVGRLSALQGDCSSAEVHRRMSEIYGEREGIYRMSNMVLQSQAGWGRDRASGERQTVSSLPPDYCDRKSARRLARGSSATLRRKGRVHGVAAIDGRCFFHSLSTSHWLTWSRTARIWSFDPREQVRSSLHSASEG
jgi:hypothetical protein